MAPRSATNVRVGAPFMHAFRQAFRDRDAKTADDVRDEAGDRVISGRLAAARSVVTAPVLRANVVRDLDNLLNTTNMNATERLTEFPAVSRSILNYGIPDVSHRTIDEEGVNEICGELETALKLYEPRIAPRTLSVTRDETIDDRELRVRFLVSAELMADPLNVPLEFLADIATDGAKITVIKT
jgi:type VI secretion system protein ImpF